MLPLSSEEKFRISSILEDVNYVFQCFWDMNQVYYTDEIPTAAVCFEEKYDKACMLLNKSFWDSLDTTNKKFVLLHECLHVLLLHGTRSIEYNKNDLDNVNIAQDICINEIIVDGFKIPRDKINDWEKYCFIDTVFKDSKNTVLKHKSFKYYLYMLKTEKNINKDLKFFDEHSDKLPDGFNDLTTDQIDDVCSETLQHFEDNSSTSEIQDLQNKLKKHVNKPSKDKNNKSKNGGKGAGNSSAYDWYTKQFKVKKSPFWLKIVKKHVKSAMREMQVMQKSWISRKRKDYALPKDFILEGLWEKTEYEKNKYKISIYLDISGSCANESQKFFQYVKSIPEEFFDIELFAFNTILIPVDIKSNNFPSGGGTSFGMIGHHLNKKETFPDAVFILTDGEGSHISINKPERVHWFLTSYNTKRYIPNGCHIHNEPKQLI